MLGHAGNNMLIGNAGADTLDGGAGDDMLIADGFEDFLDGGAGNDIVLIGGTSLADVMTLFSPVV